MKITIIAVGKVKEKFYRDALAEYGKRLGKYCRLEVVEVEDEKTPDKAGEALELQIKEKEAQRILKYVKEDAYLKVNYFFLRGVYKWEEVSYDELPIQVQFKYKN